MEEAKKDLVKQILKKKLNKYVRKNGSIQQSGLSDKKRTI